MIRFCDREIGNVEYDSLSIKELREYFLSGHEDEVLCVYDSFSTMGYIGIITYHSLQRAINVNGAICDEYVILGSDMWQEARRYFAERRGWLETKFLLPVFSPDYRLVCFAYEDTDANREIRMLRELTETPGALQFPDVYPEYKCVKIYEFNELAYFFAAYLKKQNITVQVDGVMWQGFFEGEECQIPDYECLTIHADGIGEKKRNWRENLLKSVSVEFECIDTVYEANIKEGIFRDAVCGCAELLERLRGEEIIILRAGWKEQDVYDFLLGNGIDICCFVSEKQEEQAHRVLGKPVLSESEAWHRYQNPVYIEWRGIYSAWGGGSVDFYDYIGYKRNEKYILIRDYADVPQNNLLNVLKNTQIALMGDNYLCTRLYGYLRQKMIPVTGYLGIPSEDIVSLGLPELRNEDVNDKTLCLLVEPRYYIVGDMAERQEVEEKKKRLIEYGEKNRIDNYTDYFSDMVSFINIEADADVKYTKAWMKPKRIVLGSIEPLSGNIFFKGLIDGHPSIATMGYCKLNNNLFWICVRLSVVEAERVLPLLWEMIGDSGSIFNPAAFNEKMTELLAYDSKFTSVELFAMLHVAYMHMCGRNLEKNDIKNMVIYWEPHFIDRMIMEECVRWLGTEEMSCDIINVVRNICMRHGSALKLAKINRWEKRKACNMILSFPSIQKKNYSQGDRLVVKFEDLKCNPRENLEIICDKWDIPWSDTLMVTTCHGKEDTWNGVKDFDLGPVYNTYENFFSAFDRFLIMLIDAPWQRKYGYPYVELSQFSRRELQEMFFKEFRFEKQWDTELCGDGFEDKMAIQNAARNALKHVRALEFYHYYDK